MKTRIIVILLGAFILLQPGVTVGQKAKGTKVKALDLEQIEKEIEAVMSIYQPYADKYMNELKKLKDYDEMVDSWEMVILEENLSKKSSMKDMFQAKYNEKLVAAIAKSGIAGPVFKGQVKKILKSLDFDIDRNSGTLMMYKNIENAVAPAYVGNCDVRHEFTIPKSEDVEETGDDEFFLAQGNIGTEDAKIFTATEYGSHRIDRKYLFDFSGVQDACMYRLEASGNYKAEMVYYANLCPVLIGLTTDLRILGTNEEVLFFAGDVRIPTILPFHNSDDYMGSIRPFYNGSFNIDFEVYPYQRLRCTFKSKTLTDRVLCSSFAPQLTGGYVHAYSEIKFDKTLRLAYYTYSY